MSGKLYSFQPMAVLCQCSISGSSRGYLNLSQILFSDRSRDAQRVKAKVFLVFFVTIKTSEPCQMKHKLKEMWHSVCQMLIAPIMLYPCPTISGQALWEDSSTLFQMCPDSLLNKTQACHLKFHFIGAKRLCLPILIHSVSMDNRSISLSVFLRTPHFFLRWVSRARPSSTQMENPTTPPVSRTTNCLCCI